MKLHSILDLIIINNILKEMIPFSQDKRKIIFLLSVMMVQVIHKIYGPIIILKATLNSQYLQQTQDHLFLQENNIYMHLNYNKMAIDLFKLNLLLNQ